MNAIQICLQLEFNSGALTLEEIDQKAVSACLISYAQTLLRLFEDHWNT